MSALMGLVGLDCDRSQSLAGTRQGCGVFSPSQVKATIRLIADAAPCRTGEAHGEVQIKELGCDSAARSRLEAPTGDTVLRPTLIAEGNIV